jgi:hypothetical protein
VVTKGSVVDKVRLAEERNKMKKYLTKEQTDKIFNVNTSNGCREMGEDRFHQAVNEAINFSNQGQAEVKSEIAEMTIDELYAEYERNLEMTLSERDKMVFRYAYLIGKNNLDKKG